jgi:hypothetical protein
MLKAPDSQPEMMAGPFPSAFLSPPPLSAAGKPPRLGLAVGVEMAYPACFTDDGIPAQARLLNRSRVSKRSTAIDLYRTR